MLTVDEIVAVDGEVDEPCCPACPDTDVVIGVVDNEVELPAPPDCADTDVPIVVAVDGGVTDGGADVWPGDGEYVKVGVGIVIDGNAGLGNILLICCGLI